jgi:class 3 adenylate cyclase
VPGRRTMTSLRPDELVDGGRAAIADGDWARALSLLREADGAEALAPSDVERLGEAAFWMGRLEECIEARERAYAGLVEEEEVRGAAFVALNLAFHHAGRGSIAVAGGWLESATALLSDLPECAEHGWLAWIEGIVAGEMLGDHEEAARCAERAIEIGRAVGGRDVESLGLLEKGVSFVHLGRVDEGLALLDQAMTRAVSGLLGPWASAATYCGTISTCAALGDYRRAAEWIEEVRRRPRAAHACEFPGDCRVHRGEILQLRGDWGEAEVEVARACDELEEWDAAHVAVALYELGMLSLRRGDVSAAEHAFRQVEELGGSTEPGRATLELLRGRPETASASLQDALDAAGDDALVRARLLPVATEAALAVGDVERGRRHADELEEIADQLPMVVAQRARASQARGEVAFASGEMEVARDKLREATECWHEVGARYDEARARVGLATALRELSDIDAADRQLTRAADAFERLGATFDVVRVGELMGQAAPQARVVRTFMFTDIEDSTALLAKMGDDRWSEVLRWHDTTLRRLFERFEGQEIKQRGGGDGFFVAFTAAEAALDCSLAIQKAMTEDDRDGPPIRVRIGVHEAEANRSVDDYGGRGVHEAARIAALASGGEVLVSLRTVESAGSRHEVSATRSAILKGLADPVPVTSLRAP